MREVEKNFVAFGEGVEGDEGERKFYDAVDDLWRKVRNGRMWYRVRLDEHAARRIDMSGVEGRGRSERVGGVGHWWSSTDLR